MSGQKNLRLVVFFTALLGLCPAIYALELASPEWGYALDMPEGYFLAEKSGTERYHFAHELYPVDLQMALYPATQFTAAQDAVTWVSDQIADGTKSVAFEWRKRPAAIAQLESATVGGWALALALTNDKGWLVMAIYGPANRATELEPLMISTLDSVYTDDGSWFETGPMSAFAWQAGRPIEVEYRNGPNSIALPFNEIDGEANQALVDREFSLLTAFLDTPWVIPAWKRYYRLIWRDSWSRFNRASFALGSVLPEEPESIVKELLSWTQGFSYERNFSGSDFTNLPNAFAGETGDCDSRSLLLVLLLNQLGIDAILLVSPEYSHAVAAVDCPGTGARYESGGKKYLIADPTAKVGPGLIAQDMADTSKWFSVSFYAFPQKRD